MTALTEASELRTFPEARAQLRVAASTLRLMVDDGQLPIVKVRGRRLIPQAAINEFVRRHTFVGHRRVAS